MRGDCRSFQTSACSRPPPPKTRTFIFFRANQVRGSRGKLSNTQSWLQQQKMLRHPEPSRFSGGAKDLARANDAFENAVRRVATLIRWRGPSLQISPYQRNQILRQLFRRIRPALRMRNMQPDMVFKNFRHQAVHSTANRREQHEDVRAFVSVRDRAFHSADLSSQPLDARK